MTLKDVIIISKGADLLIYSILGLLHLKKNVIVSRVRFPNFPNCYIRIPMKLDRIRNTDKKNCPELNPPPVNTAVHIN